MVKCGNDIYPPLKVNKYSKQTFEEYIHAPQLQGLTQSEIGHTEIDYRKLSPVIILSEGRPSGLLNCFTGWINSYNVIPPLPPTCWRQNRYHIPIQIFDLQSFQFFENQESRELSEANNSVSRYIRNCNSDNLKNLHRALFSIHSSKNLFFRFSKIIFLPLKVPGE